MKQRNRETARQGFTLIELMIVMAIIGVLIAMLFAGITGVIKSAKKTRAQASISTIATASRSYWSTYGNWPPKSGSSPWLAIVNSGTLFVNCMSGNDPDLNPRGIRFMDFPQSSLIGTSGAQVFIDPYGITSAGAYTLYSVYYDSNGDGWVSSTDNAVPSFSGTSSISGGVAIWCWGPDRTNNWGASDDITSWK